mgnify:CR=1 FL=1
MLNNGFIQWDYMIPHFYPLQIIFTILLLHSTQVIIIFYLGFRKKLIRGNVHDPTAYSFGGVAGHAGYFSTARDL